VATISPHALIGVRHETQDQFPGEQTSRQPFGVPKVVLASLRRPIGMRLRQVQLRKVRFQIHPNRFPVLRRGFHHYLRNAPFPQPVHQTIPLTGPGSKPAALEFESFAGPDFAPRPQPWRPSPSRHKDCWS